MTGSLIAEGQQGTIIGQSLSRAEWAVVALIVIVIGAAFRSLLAPVITLATAAVAYLISQWVPQQATIHFGVTVPPELSPIIIVLLLGVATDYCVFFFAEYRQDLRRGRPDA